MAGRSSETLFPLELSLVRYHPIGCSQNEYSRKLFAIYKYDGSSCLECPTAEGISTIISHNGKVLSKGQTTQ